MATVGLYGSSTSGVVPAASGAESTGLYGNNVNFGGSYFEWFIFQQADTQPATPTGGSWDFSTNTGVAPAGWSSVPFSAPTNKIWVSIALVNSKNATSLTWSAPGLFSYSSGLPILSGNGTPASGAGQSDQLYIQLDTSPQTIWFKESGTWTSLTGSSLYVDLTNNQTIAGTKTFSSQIQGSISGTASNVTGVVGISNGGTGSTTAAGSRTALGAAASGANSDITSLSGLTTPLSVAQGGTGANNAAGARANLSAAESGTNADITSMTALTGGISTPDFVQFHTAITPTVGIGKLQWDPTWGCMQVGMAGGNVNLQIGEETLAYVYNNTGATITEGQVVKVTGAQGQRLTVALAQADSDSNSATILGMATESIANNASGFITTQGLVNNINTSGYADGTLLYLSPTTAGAVTSTKPIAPQHLVWIGYVVKGGSGGAGSIYIHTQNGYEIDELHDVRITTPVADNSFLVYDTGLAVWQNESPATARTSMGLGTSAVLNAGVANGVATLDAGGTIPLSQIPASIQGGVSYQGTWNASTNTPTLTSSVGTKGYYYVVSVAGSTNLNGVTDWKIGDWAIFNGSAWEKVDNTDAVTSVNGYTGTVTLAYSDVGAPSTSGTNATGTWGINITGDAATATSATTATTATNVSGGTANVTTLTTSSTVTLSGGTANGVAYLNGSKVLTTGSALTFDGTNFGVSGNQATAIATTLNNSNATVNAGSILKFNFGATNTGYVWNYYDGADFITALYGAKAVLWNIGSAGGSEQMRLTSTGLGIGTSSPLVSAAGRGNVTINGSADSILAFGSAGTNTGYLYATTSGLELASIGSTYVRFSTSGTERMRLDASGNLGLGVTPSAWNGVFKAFQVGDRSALSQDGNTTYLSNNYVRSDNFRYLVTAAASDYYQANGAHIWRTAPSGTAGNAISFTQAMTLNAAGDLGLGTTSPTNFSNRTTMSLQGAWGGLVNILVGSTSHCTFGTDNFASGLSCRIWSQDGTAFYNSSGRSMTLDSSGNLLVGTTSVPSSAGSGAGWVTAANGFNGVLRSRTGTGTYGVNGFSFYWSGSSAQLWVDSSNIGIISTTSDYRVKRNIETQVLPALERVMQLRPVTYQMADYGSVFKSSEEVREGFIAHEVQAVIPSGADGVKDDPDQIQSLRVDAILSVAVKAIQEQQSIINQLKADVAALKGA